MEEDKEEEEEEMEVEEEEPEEEPKVVYLGDRNEVIFPLGQGNSNSMKISDDFFELSVEEVKRLYQQQVQVIKVF